MKQNHCIKTIPGVFGTIGVYKAVETTQNPVIYALCSNNDQDQIVDRLRFQDGAPPANGWCIEDILKVAKDRIEHLNSELPSRYNDVAIEHLDAALEALSARLAERRPADSE